MDKISYKDRVLPAIPLRGLWIYPHMVMHFDVGRKGSIKAVEEALDNDSKIFLVSQKNIADQDPSKEDLYRVGVIANIKQTINLPNNAIRVLVEGKSRAIVKEFSEADGFEAQVDEVIYDELDESDEVLAGKKLLADDLYEYEKYNKNSNPEILISLGEIEEAGKLADTIASYIQLDLKDHMEILGELETYLRLVSLHKILDRQKEILKIKNEIEEKVKERIDESQREYFLREELDFINEELGGKETSQNIEDEYREKMKEMDLPDYVLEAVNKELKKISSLSPLTPELNVSRSYLDYVLDIPWNTYTDTAIDIARTRKVLNEDHYGLEDVKDRILEYVAVMKKTGKLGSQILCFVGPPGVGKTSISRSIAHSLNREFVSMRLGGVRDEAEIRGHRRTYIGAMPGKIVKLLIDAKAMNPVFLLDEIDKLSSNFTGDPASALLEVLDPEQNDEFRDHYIDLALDLSKVFFITTANSLDTIPSALLDRMEIIRLSGYTYEEKLAIAKNHLIPKVMKEHGLEKSEFSISDAALKDIITDYTREAGVRDLERMIARLARRSVMQMVEKGKKSISISIRNLTDYAGQPIYIDDEKTSKAEVGTVTGLAWTQVGGVILQIEANVLPGSSKLDLTGKLGDVMKESAWAGLSFIRANYEKLGLAGDFYKDKDIHIHIPEGATPKDGPSAGITMASAMVSALTGKKVRSDVAMTGEITITGRVLPVGGIKEKLLAAKRHGIHKLILPKKNEKDVKELKPSEIEDMEITYVERFPEVLDLVMIDED